MLGEFTYCNPTRLYFGKNALDGLRQELPKYGPTVLLCYGSGSIRKNGMHKSGNCSAKRVWQNGHRGCRRYAKPDGAKAL